jgi:hypothetical protein
MSTHTVDMCVDIIQKVLELKTYRILIHVQYLRTVSVIYTYVTTDLNVLPTLQTPTLTLALLSLTTLMAACSVLGYPTGAPAEACKSLTPRHYSVPQLDPGTISLVVSKRVNGTLQEVVHYKPNMTYQGTLKLP